MMAVIAAIRQVRRPHTRGRPAGVPPSANSGTSVFPPSEGRRDRPERQEATAQVGRGTADATEVSLDSALARIAELNSALAPAQPQGAPPASGAGFQSALDGAMAQPAASAASAPGSYAYLKGDLDASPELLRRLDPL